MELPRGTKRQRKPTLPNSTWMEDAELSEHEYEAGTLLLGRDDAGRLIGTKDDRHIMTIAGSRSGKSSTCLKPSLMLWDSSALVIDPKGELATETAAQRASMGQQVFILDPFNEVKGEAAQYRCRYDPLSEIKAGAEDDIIDNAALIAESLIVPDKDAKSEHWTLGAKNLLRGLILYAILLEQGDGERATLNKLRKWITSSVGDGDDDEDTGDDEVDNDRDIWLTTRFRMMSGRDEFSGVVAGVGQTMMGKPRGERGSIISTAVEQLSFLDSKPMKDQLGDSDLPLLPSLRILKQKPSTIYLVLPASRMGSHFRWLRTILTLAIASLENEPHQLGKDKRVLFVLEEMFQLGHLKILESSAGLAAGYFVKLWGVLQDLTQLKGLYRDSWETFIGNAGVLQFFGNTDVTTTEYVSKKLGTLQITETTQAHITPSSAVAGGQSTSETQKGAALLAPFEVSQYCERETQRQIILFAGKPPAYIWRMTHEEVRAIGG